mmetsp:Transcript_17750/g.56744  ORF Transcript_17750/g.56744 Transcript_17750/m.56744 type:complete len:282 (+) Transcript_17750:278-1123(+)
MRNDKVDAREELVEWCSLGDHETALLFVHGRLLFQRAQIRLLASVVTCERDNRGLEGLWALVEDLQRRFQAPRFVNRHRRETNAHDLLASVLGRGDEAIHFLVQWRGGVATQKDEVGHANVGRPVVGLAAKGVSFDRHDDRHVCRQDPLKVVLLYVFIVQAAQSPHVLDSAGKDPVLPPALDVTECLVALQAAELHLVGVRLEVLQPERNDRRVLARWQHCGLEEEANARNVERLADDHRDVGRCERVAQVVWLQALCPVKEGGLRVEELTLCAGQHCGVH